MWRPRQPAPDRVSTVTSSPFGSGDPFSDLFDRFFGMSPAASPPAVQRVPIGRLLSDSSHDLLAAAGARAAEDGSDLATEHLLWAATQVAPARRLLEQAASIRTSWRQTCKSYCPQAAGTGSPP